MCVLDVFGASLYTQRPRCPVIDRRTYRPYSRTFWPPGGPALREKLAGSDWELSQSS